MNDCVVQIKAVYKACTRYAILWLLLGQSYMYKRKSNLKMKYKSYNAHDTICSGYYLSKECTNMTNEAHNTVHDNLSLMWFCH